MNKKENGVIDDISEDVDEIAEDIENIGEDTDRILKLILFNQTHMMNTLDAVLGNRKWMQGLWLVDKLIMVCIVIGSMLLALNI